MGKPPSESLFDREQAAAAREHQLLLSREERAHGDKSRAYEEMLIEVGRGVRYVRLTRPQFGGGQPPAKSSDDDTLRVHALIYAFGSTRMQDLLDSWEDATNEFAWIDKSLSTLENRPEPSRDRGWELEWEGRSAELEPARKAALDRADEIIALANNELPDAERVAALAFELGPHGLMVWVGGLTGLR